MCSVHDALTRLTPFRRVVRSIVPMCLAFGSLFVLPNPAVAQDCDPQPGCARWVGFHNSERYIYGVFYNECDGEPPIEGPWTTSASTRPTLAGSVKMTS